MKQIFLLSLIISLFLAATGCAAVEYGSTAPVVIGALETIQGMQAVVKGAPGTMALVSSSGEWIVLVWPKGVNYALVMVSSTGKALDLNAIKMPCCDLAQGVNGLIAHGWKQLQPGELPVALVQAVMAYSVELIATGAQALPTILMVPLVEPFEIIPVEVQS